MMVRPGGGRESRKIRNKSSRFVPPPRLKAKGKLLPSSQANHNYKKQKCEIRCQAEWEGGGGQEVMDGWIPRAVYLPNTSEGKSLIRIKPVCCCDVVIYSKGKLASG